MHRTHPAEIAHTIRTQVGTGALLNLGARDYLYLADGLSFRIGNGRRRAVVRLNAWDLYEASIVTTRGRVEWQSGTGLAGLYADQLAEALIRAHDEVTS